MRWLKFETIEYFENVQRKKETKMHEPIANHDTSVENVDMTLKPSSIRHDITKLCNKWKDITMSVSVREEEEW